MGKIIQNWKIGLSCSILLFGVFAWCYIKYGSWVFLLPIVLGGPLEVLVALNGRKRER